VNVRFIVGGHDENIHPSKLATIAASEVALEKWIIIADTKFEFGLDENGVWTHADEVLTPGIINVQGDSKVTGRIK
jgi:hypothetical protein